MQIAQTILSQLGGNKFLAMTGAQCVAGTNWLTVILPRASRKINSIVIRLEADDTYHMSFNRRTNHGLNITQQASEHGVYADMLQTMFTAHTGLATSL